MALPSEGPMFGDDAEPTDHDIRMRRPPSRVRRRARSVLDLVPGPPRRLVDTRGKFVIFAQGRSGSTLLVDLLKSHPSVHCSGEIMLEWRWLPLWSIGARMVWSRADTYGFKLLSYQPEGVQAMAGAAPMLDRLIDRGFQVVYLHREDVLRHALSQLNARFNNFSGFDGPASRKLQVEREALLWWLEAIARQRRVDDELMAEREHLDVTYEADLEDRSRWQPLLDRFCSFVDLPSAVPSSNMTKVSSTRLSDLVANREELPGMLAGTDFAGLADRD